MENRPSTRLSKMSSRGEMKQNFGNNKDEASGRKEENNLNNKVEKDEDEDMEEKSVYNNVHWTDEIDKSKYDKKVSESLPTKRCLRERKCKPKIPSPSHSDSSSDQIEEKVTPPRKPLKKRKVKPKKPSSGSTQPCSSKTANVFYPDFDETLMNENGLSTNSVDETAIVPGKQGSVVSLGLSTMFDSIEIDSNVVDIYSNKPPFSPEPEVPDIESPEMKRRRVDSENMIIAKQCRLHPTNKKYNQGPVVNPPLMSPGNLVGYTPAGQRHQVNLNYQRPTWFNSEYARMQFDDATRINVRRMFNELESGMFLPDSLDPDVERRYNAERDLAEIEATVKFNKIMEGIKKKADDVLELFEDEDVRFLEAEQELLEMNEFATVKFEDFPSQLADKLNRVLTLQLLPLMFKKHPIIVETLQKLTRQNSSLLVAKSARALLDKIESLFDVPESKSFLEHFASEVAILKEKTKDMDWCDILIMCKEPTGISEQEETVQNPEEAERPNDQEVRTTNEPILREPREEWIPVEDGDEWIDIGSSSDESFDDSVLSTCYDEDTVTEESEQSDGETDYDSDDEYSDDDLLTALQDQNQPLYEQNNYYAMLEADQVVEE